MNFMLSPSAAVAAAPLVTPTALSSGAGPALVAAAGLLLADLERGVRIDALILRTAMISAFGGSDAEGAWDWKTAYDACEAAQILFLRKFGPAMRGRAVSPSAFLALLDKVAALLPSHTRRSEESQALQQFSTPIGLGFVASVAAAITPTDLVLEPSAGTGLLAIHAELAGGDLVLNELADSRADLLGRLFPGVAVTRYDAAHIETMLSLRSALPCLPMVAALSANHLAALLFPPTLRRLYIARDDDPAGGVAMATLTERARIAGIEALGLSPMLGDFNEDLRHLGVDDLRSALRAQLAPDDVPRLMESLASAGTER